MIPFFSYTSHFGIYQFTSSLHTYNTASPIAECRILFIPRDPHTADGKAIYEDENQASTMTALVGQLFSNCSSCKFRMGEIENIAQVVTLATGFKKTSGEQ